MGAAISKRGAYNLQKREKKSKKGEKLEERAASFICLSQAQIYEDAIKTPMPELTKHQSLHNVFENHYVTNPNANKELEAVSSKSSSEHNDYSNPHDEKIYEKVLENESDYEEQVERKNSNIISLIQGEREANNWEPQEIKESNHSESSYSTNKDSDRRSSSESWKEVLNDQFWITEGKDTQNKQVELNQKSDEQIEVDEQNKTEEQVLVVEDLQCLVGNEDQVEIINDQVIQNPKDQILNTTVIAQNKDHKIKEPHQKEEQVEITIPETNETPNKNEHEYEQIEVSLNHKEQDLTETTSTFEEEKLSQVTNKHLQDAEDETINAHHHHEIQEVAGENKQTNPDGQNIIIDAEDSKINTTIVQNNQKDENQYHQILEVIENQETANNRNPSVHNKFDPNQTNLTLQEEEQTPTKKVTFEDDDASESSDDNLQELQSENITTSQSDQDLNGFIVQNKDIEKPNKDQEMQTPIFDVNKNQETLAKDNDFSEQVEIPLSPKVTQKTSEKEDKQSSKTSTETSQTPEHENIDPYHHNTDDEGNFWEQVEVLDEQVEVLNENVPSQQKPNDTNLLEEQTKTAEDTSSHRPLHKSISTNSDMFYELAEESGGEDQELFYDAESFDDVLLNEQVEITNQLVSTQTIPEINPAKNVNHHAKDVEIENQMSDDEKLEIIDEMSKTRLAEEDKQKEDKSDGANTDPKEEFLMLQDTLIIDAENPFFNDTKKTSNYEDLLPVFTSTQSDLPKVNSSDSEELEYHSKTTDLNILLDLNNDVSESLLSNAKNSHPKPEETQNDHSRINELKKEENLFNKTDDLHPSFMLLELKEDQSGNPFKNALKPQEVYTEEDNNETNLFIERKLSLEQTALINLNNTPKEDSTKEATNQQPSSANQESFAPYTPNDMSIDLSQLNFTPEPQNKSPPKSPQELQTTDFSKTISKPNNLPLPTNTQNASRHQEHDLNLELFAKSTSITTPEEVAEGQMKIWGQQKDEGVEEVILQINAIAVDIHDLNAEIDKLGCSEKDKEIQTEMYQMLIKIMRDVNKINNHDFNEKIIELQHRALNEVHECLRKLKTKSSS